MQKKRIISFDEMIRRIQEENASPIVLPQNQHFIKDLEQRNVPELGKIQKGAKKSKSGVSLHFAEDMIAKLLKDKEVYQLETASELYLKYRDAFDVEVYVVVYNRLQDACETARREMEEG